MDERMVSESVLRAAIEKLEERVDGWYLDDTAWFSGVMEELMNEVLPPERPSPFTIEEIMAAPSYGYTPPSALGIGDVYSNGNDTVYVPRGTTPQIGDMMFVPDGPWTPTRPGWEKNADGYWQRRVVEGDYGPMGEELYNSMVDPVTGLPEQKPDQVNEVQK